MAICESARTFAFASIGAWGLRFFYTSFGIVRAKVLPEKFTNALKFTWPEICVVKSNQIKPIKIFYINALLTLKKKEKVENHQLKALPC